MRSRCTASTAQFLEDKPKFGDIVDDLIEFVKNAEVIIHNAEFDIEFLDAELGRIGRNRFADHCLKVICSLQHAREQHPGKRNSLDALCERYAVSNAHRTLHGALLDAGLLADVFLAMTRGQDSLVIDVLDDDALTANFGPIDVSQLIAVAVAAEEIAAHEALARLDCARSEGHACMAVGSCSRVSCSRSSRFNTLPVAFLGNCSTNT